MKPNQSTILLIDDDQMIRNSIRTYLEDSGFQVIVAENALIGLDTFHVYKVDLVLLDLRMPEMDGLELLDIIHKESPDTPVIIISGAGGLKDAIEALQLGAVDYITKPIHNMAILENAVCRSLERYRLIMENNKYRKHLENEIERRTARLKEQTEALGQSESRFRELIEVFDGFIYTCDKHFHMTFMNKKLQDHVGRNAEGELCYKVLYDLDQKCSWCRHEIVFKGQTLRHEMQNPMDGRWYYIIHVPVRNSLGEVIQKQATIIDINDRKSQEEALRVSEANLREENSQLLSSLKSVSQFGPMIGKSPAMRKVYEIILKAALSNANIIIFGESGTGKELVAKTIHELSKRNKNKFIPVNCSAIPDNLIESEFFGYKKGAFTGAISDKPGLIAMANGGTLFLDEIGEINLNMQAKLLRVIDGGGYMPLGTSDLIPCDFRIIAATNKDLKEMVKNGNMREDFYFRIHIIPVYLPPLRDRREDISLLVQNFMQKYAEDDSSIVIPSNIMKSMQRQYWKGNVRELENTVQRYITLKEFIPSPLSNERSIKEKPDFSEPVIPENEMQLKDVLKIVEKKYITQLLECHKWNRSKVSNILGIDRRTLFRKIKEYDID